MHFHLPKPLRGWREFAGEVGIIVLGVLIALFFEQLAQNWEWNHKIRIAEDQMQTELLRDDGPQIYQRAAMHPCVVARLDAIRGAVEGSATRKQIATLIDGYWVEYRTFDHLALDAATTSDTLARIPPRVGWRFKNIYAVMSVLDRISSQEAADLSRLRAFRRTGGPVSDEEKDRVLTSVEALRTDDEIISSKSADRIAPLQRLGRLDPKPLNELMQRARQHYGSCVKELTNAPLNG